MAHGVVASARRALKPGSRGADTASMNRVGVLATAGGAVAIGLAPVVPLLMAHNDGTFKVPDVHFYAVSATALLCAALAVALGVVGVRRRDRRSAAIGAGFTVMAALLAVHGLTTPGFLIEAGYTPPSASRARSRCRSAARSSSPRCSRGRASAATCATSSACSSASSPPRSRSARSPCSSPRRSRASRSRCARSSGGSSAPTRSIYGVLALRALRTFQLTRRIGDLAVVAGLAWLAIAVATYLLSPTWSVGFWAGHVLELGAFLVISGALASDLARATPSRTLSAGRRPERRHRGGGAARRLGRAPARPARRQGHLDARAHAARRAARRPGRPGARPARRAAAQPRRGRAAARRRQAAGAGRRSSARPRR